MTPTPDKAQALKQLADEFANACWNYGPNATGTVKYRTALDAAIDAACAPVPQGAEAVAPAGFKFVPLEPTMAMIAAGAETPGMKAIDSSSQVMQLRGYPLNPEDFKDGGALAQSWRAMLAAAPLAKPEPSSLARDFPPMGGLTECDMGDSYE